MTEHSESTSLTPTKKMGRPATTRIRAIRLIKSLLQGKLIVPASDAHAALREAGIDRATRYRARTRLGIHAHRVGNNTFWTRLDRATFDAVMAAQAPGDPSMNAAEEGSGAS